MILPVPTLPELVCYPCHHVQSYALHSERGLVDGFLCVPFRNSYYIGTNSLQIHRMWFFQGQKYMSLLDCKPYKNIKMVILEKKVDDAFCDTTCGFGHAPLSDVFAAWHSTTFRARLLPLFVAPLPVWVGLKMGFFDLTK